MQRPASPVEVVTLSDVRAAQVLLDREARTWFRPFFGRPSTVSEAARALGRPANSVLYRVREWQRLGLLTVAHEERRRGRIIRHYRSAADHFFIPQALTPARDLTELLRMINAPYLELSYASQVAFAQRLSPKWGVQFAHWGEVVGATGPGQIWQADAASQQVLLDHFCFPQLDQKDALRFQAELLTLLDRYGQDTGHTTYICHLSLVALTK
ncbi:helix-turn-helix transcriptional regulator [Deinococcus saxicola]|uniref:hypothetical protein n=1 Tax=Deinococcus saxicola TaxID=249406 RepID=UPI0039F13716